MKFNAVTIGSATRDALFQSDDFKTIDGPEFTTGKALAMDFGGKIKIDKVYFSTGGAATNTAVTFKRQGLKTAAIFRVGKDLSGKTIKEEMAREKINVSFCQEDKNLATAYSVILEHRSGERTILVFRGANENLDWRKIPWNKFKTDCLYLTSLSGDLNILKEAVNYRKKNKCLIAWNPGSSDLKLGLEKLLPFLADIDIFIVNQEEASELLNIPYQETRLIFKKLDEIISGIAVMTKGPQGVFVSDGKHIFEAEVFAEKKVADRTGAGDAFGSGFVAGLLNSRGRPREFSEKDIKYAIRLGSANATSKIENLGAKAGLLTKKEFEKSPRFKNLPIQISSLL